MPARRGSRPLASAASASRRRAVIGLTPLIDVVFILLVFFMLASSFLDWRSIELRAPGPAASSTLEGTLFVELREGGLRLAGLPITLPALLAKATALTAPKVVLRAAPGVPLQQAVTVLDRLAGAGITNIALVER